MDVYGQAQATSETEGPSSDSDESTVLINTQADENFEESSEKFVETQPQESYNTFESLDQFDSLLDLPSFTQQDTQSIFQQSESLNPSIGRPAAVTQYQRSVSDVVSKLPNRPLSQSILIQSLDIFDLKFLLTRIGVPHGSKSNKTTLSEKVYFALKNGRFADILPQGAKVVTRNMLPPPGAAAQVPMTAGRQLGRSASLFSVVSGPSVTLTAAQPGLHLRNTSSSASAGSSGPQGGGSSARELVRSASLPAQAAATQPAMSSHNPRNLQQSPAPSSTVSTAPRVYFNTAVLDGAAASWQAVDSDTQAALSRASTTDNAASSSTTNNSTSSSADSRLYTDIERVMHAPQLSPRQPSADSSAEPIVLGTVVIEASDWRPVEQDIQDALNVNDPRFVSHCLLQLLRTTKHLGSFSKVTLSDTSSSHDITNNIINNSNSNNNSNGGGVVVSADSPDTAMQVVSEDSSNFSSTQQSTNTAFNSSSSSSSSMPSLYDIDCSTGEGEGDTFEPNQSVVVSARRTTRSGIVGVAATAAVSTVPDVVKKQKKRPHSAVMVDAVSSVAADKMSVGTDGTAAVASTTSCNDKNNRKYSDVVASLRERVIPKWTAMRLQQQQQAFLSVPGTAAVMTVPSLIHSAVVNNSASQWQSNTASAATFNTTHTQQQTAVVATSSINNSWRSGTQPYRLQSHHVHGHGHGHGVLSEVPTGTTSSVVTASLAQPQLAPLTAAAAPVKLAYFHNTSLGLVLAKVRATDGTEQTVIQSKNSDRGGTQNNNRVGNHGRYKSTSHMVQPPQALDPQIARILSVGDRLVSINGTSIEGMPFAVQINMIKTTPRPIALGFTSSL